MKSCRLYIAFPLSSLSQDTARMTQFSPRLIKPTVSSSVVSITGRRSEMPASSFLCSSVFSENAPRYAPSDTRSVSIA